VVRDDTPELARHRAEVRAWLDANRHGAPALRPTGPDREEPAHVAARRAWQARLADAGLIGATWPTDCGGRGLTPAHELVIEQELDDRGLPGAFDVVGIGMLGPAIIAHGSERQRRRYLPPLLRADEVWCQLFSEPGAGSDLAAIATRAKRHRDGSWRVSGQKVWTSNAQHAAFGLMLARTNPGRPRHRGLTMFVVPMDTTGVRVRALRQLSGEARFSEVFLDDVDLPANAVIGGVDDGWSVAMDTLGFERVAIGRTADSLTWRVEELAAALAEDPHAAVDPVVRRRFGEIAGELLALRASGELATDGIRRRRPPDPASALTKITAVGAMTRAGELLVDTLGPGALDLHAGWGRLVSDLPGLRSAGGTEEIVRNQVGERVLGLPREPTPDADRMRSRPRPTPRSHPFLDESHEAVRTAARAALCEGDWPAAARGALDGGPRPDAWTIAVRAGLCGALVAEEHGGAGLGPLGAMVVTMEAGRALAPAGLLGHLPASLLVAGSRSPRRAALLGELATGRLRAACVLARPPAGGDERYTVEPLGGHRRPPAPCIDGDGRVTGSAGWVPDAPGADILVVCARDRGGRPVAVLVQPDAATIRHAEGYDPSRALAHLCFDAARSEPLEATGATVDSAWFLTQALLGAEGIGSVGRLLELGLAHARSRVAFGRAIGSFQAVKHQLVEVLRRRDNARALMLAAGRIDPADPGFATAASALRLVAGDALDFAARAVIGVHGGIGVAWEHDLTLYYRRAQLSRRLLGGHAGAADHVGGALLGHAAERRPS
jgi:alkylation response protein AidB-like acyl-CoA dehydrogenase